jgi:molecular chaperone DnaK (HSP70)
MSHPPIGIDLGTTFSKIAAFVNGNLISFSDINESYKIPSVVSFDSE